MKTPIDDQDATPPDWMRWLDEEMTATERAEFEGRMAADPALRAEVEDARRFSQMLKQELPAEMEVPHADFFNSQIQVRLSQMETDERRAAATAVKPGWFEWLRSPWLAASAAAAMVAMLLLRPDGAVVSQSETLVMSTYAPNPNVLVSSFHSTAAEATVLMLDGLEELPADRKIVGWQLNNGVADPASLSTVFHGASGQIEVVMTRDARNQPRVWKPRS